MTTEEANCTQKISPSWLNHWKALAVQLIVPLAGSIGSLAHDVHEQGLLVSLDVVGHGDGVAVRAGIQTPVREWLQDTMTACACNVL